MPNKKSRRKQAAKAAEQWPVTQADMLRDLELHPERYTGDDALFQGMLDDIRTCIADPSFLDEMPEKQELTRELERLGARMETGGPGPSEEEVQQVLEIGEVIRGKEAADASFTDLEELD